MSDHHRRPEPVLELLDEDLTVNVFVNAVPPAHSFSYVTLMVSISRLTLLRVRPVVRRSS